MSFELTPEQRQAVLAGGVPLHIHDAETQKVFVLIEQGAEPAIEDEYVLAGLDVARQQIEQGAVSKRDIESVIVEARRRASSGN